MTCCPVIENGGRTQYLPDEVYHVQGCGYIPHSTSDYLASKNYYKRNSLPNAIVMKMLENASYLCNHELLTQSLYEFTSETRR
eukprot:5378770-Amphidinium_carterae.1